MGELVLVGGALAQWAVTGALLARRPRHPVTVALTVMSAALVVQLLTPVASTVAAALWVLGPPMLAVLLVVFPDGARGRRWAWVLRYQVVVLAFCVVAEAMWPGERPPAVAVVMVLGLGAFIPIAAVAVVSLVLLRRRATGARRARIGVVLAAGAALVAGYVVGLPLTLALGDRLPVIPSLLELWISLFFTLPAVAIGLSVLMEPVHPQRPVVDAVALDLLVAAGAVVVGGTAAGVTAVVTGVAPRWGDVVVPSLAVAAATVAAVTLARHGAALVPTTDDRTASGLRDLASCLSAAPAPEEVPTVVATTVGATLELRGTALEVRLAVGYERLATWGDPAGREVTRLLEHAGETVGRLVLVPHEDGVPVDLTALDALLPPVAAVVAATRLTVELERAHGRLVRIRDEERARLRADMHDELSPSLAGVRLTVVAARDRLALGDVAEADAMLARVDAEAGRAGTVVRSILEDLRPDELVQRGLLAAVRDRASALSRPGSFHVDVEAPAALPPLTPETELAVYRTVTEALANAARHSRGQCCSVRLSPEGDDLVLEVTDDGIGLPPRPRTGLGLSSMSARAAGVGGRLEVGSGRSGGACVSARFPLEVTP